MSRIGHLVGRFLGSLWPGGPAPADEAWALHHLVPGEQELWRRMPGFDRRHAVGVARRTATELGTSATRPVMAAALLHDVGKIDSGLGVFRRVVATVVATVRGSERTASGEGPIARYVNHPVIGAQMLVAAGSNRLTVDWAAQHHLSPSSWTIDEPIALALKNADDD